MVRPKLPVLLLVGLAFLASAAYMFSYMNTGWLPQDDGTLAQAALRVLHHQLPHRDFVEGYTGGLDYLNALAFLVFGVKLTAMRAMMFLFFLAWLPAVFYVASRFLSAIPAAAIMVLAAVWGVPNYPTPMPSWYNMFFAVFGAAALLRYLETEHRRWLCVAGLCGGLSFLIKVIGLYYVAAVLLFLIFREQILNGSPATKPSRPRHFYRLFVILGLLAFLAMIVLMMWRRFDEREFVQFFLPSAALVVLLIWRELRQRSAAADGRRFAALFQMAAPFLLGLAIPIVLFLSPYAMSGTLGAFTHGVFGEGFARAQALGIMRPADAISLLLVLPLVAVIAAAAFWKRDVGPLFSIPVACAGILLLLAAFHNANCAEAIWTSAAASTPVFVALGAVLILIGPSFADDLSPLRQQQLMLLLALTAVCSLVQFPFSVKIYFCYFAPLLVLAVAAITSVTKRHQNAEVLLCVLVFYAIFAITKVTPAAVYEFYVYDLPESLTSAPIQTLNLPRAGGLKVRNVQFYDAMVRTVLEHAGTGPVLAMPECPEVYFLSGLRNPSRNDNGIPPQELLQVLKNNDDLNVVVVNDSSTFSVSTLTPEVMAAITTNFPQRVKIDKYWVCWRQ